MAKGTGCGLAGQSGKEGWCEKGFGVGNDWNWGWGRDWDFYGIEGKVREGREEGIGRVMSGRTIRGCNKAI